MRQILMHRIACVLLLWGVSWPAMSQTQVIRRANTARTQLETAGNERLAPLESEASEAPASNASAPQVPATLPSVAVPATPDGPRTVATPRTIEFAAPDTPQSPATSGAVSPEVLARWHVRNNLCSQQNWSLQEFQLLFPAITPEMIRQVCEI